MRLLLDHVQLEVVEVDFDLLQDWVHTLLQTRGPQIFRMKGVLAVAEQPTKLVFQAVHMVVRAVGKGPGRPYDARHPAAPAGGGEG